MNFIKFLKSKSTRKAFGFRIGFNRVVLVYLKPSFGICVKKIPS